MKRTLFLIFVLGGLLGCAPSGQAPALQAPEQAEAAAKSELDAHIVRLKESISTVEYDSSKVYISRSQELSPSNNLNRNPEQWCIGLGFELYRTDISVEDSLFAVLLVSNRNLGWEANIVDTSEQFSEPAEYYEHVWDLCLQN